MENKTQSMIELKESLANKFIERGVIVRLDTGNWCGTTSLNEEDLGIKVEGAEAKAVMKNVVSLGRKYLYPKHKLNELNKHKSWINGRLKAKSFPTEFGGRFIPLKVFSEFVEEFETAQEKFNKLVDNYSVPESWEEERAKTKEEYILLITDAVKRVNKVDTLTTEQIELVLDIVGRIVAQIPSANSFKSSVRFEYYASMVPKFTPDFDEAQKTEIELKAIELVKSECNQMKFKQIQSLFDSVIGGMYGMIGSAVSEALESIKDGTDNRAIGGAKRRLKTMMTKLDDIDVTDSEKLKVQIEDIKDQIELLNENNNDTTSLVKSLESLKTYTEEIVDSIGITDMEMSAKFLELY